MEWIPNPWWLPIQVAVWCVVFVAKKIAALAAELAR